MNSMKPILILLLHLFIDYAFFAIAQTTEFGIYKCRNNGNFTTNSTYHINLETALSSLSPNVRNHGGFYNSSVGQEPNTVNAITLCRGDLGPESCQDCVRNSIPLLRQNCPNQKEATTWNSNCLVRYSIGTIFGVVNNWASDNVSSTEIASNIDGFNKALRNLTGRLRAEAAQGNSVRKFATGNITVRPNSFTIYGLMQCTPDLSSKQCSECLQSTITGIQECCSGRVGARIFFPSCLLKYANEQFYSDSPPILVPSPPFPTPPSISGKKRNKAKTIHVIVTVTCVSLALMGICFLLRKAKQNHRASKKECTSSFSFLLTKEKQNQTSSTNDSVGTEITTVQSLQYDLETIKGATDYFSHKNKIGKGGFGLVYKGVLPNGQEVAVKRLSKTSNQGAKEFVNEAILVAKLQHRNLVRLVGFCHEAKEKILIYEYVPNKSLDYFLFDPVKHGHLDWPTRYKIIGGITKGMLYLHEDSLLRIIHRDLKASNILLDQGMNAKISDFGLARIFGVDQIQGNTKKIAGTLGYMSPEYTMHGHFSVKSDVFSFGVIVLEIVSGKRNSSFYLQNDVKDLLYVAWKQWMDGRPLELLDPTLAGSYSRIEVIRCINIGLLCVQEDVDVRPSMASVLNMLSGYSITLASPKKPPYFLSKGLMLDIPIDNNKPIPIARSTDDSLITELHPR